MKVKLKLADTGPVFGPKVQVCGGLFMATDGVCRFANHYPVHQYWRLALDVPGVFFGVGIVWLAFRRIKSTLADG